MCCIFVSIKNKQEGDNIHDTFLHIRFGHHYNHWYNWLYACKTISSCNIYWMTNKQKCGIKIENPNTIWRTFFMNKWFIVLTNEIEHTRYLTTNSVFIYCSIGNQDHSRRPYENDHNYCSKGVPSLKKKLAIFGGMIIHA